MNYNYGDKNDDIAVTSEYMIINFHTSSVPGLMLTLTLDLKFKASVKLLVHNMP